MRMFRSRPPAFVALAAMVAALAVHQARYTLLPEHDAESHHGYLAYAPGLLGMVLAAALGLALARLLAGAEPAAPRRTALPARWIGATVLLIAVHGVQELAEGHAAELVGNGAGLVVPLAAAAGLALALVLDGARGALRAGAQALRRLAPRVRTRVAVVASWHPSLAPAPRRLPALAAAGAGRGPPPVG